MTHPSPPYPELIDERTGIIRRLEAATIPEHFPPSFALTTAVLSDTTQFSRWPSDPAGAGYAFADPAAVRAAAIGEAIERYCGNLVPPGLTEATYLDLQRDGQNAVDPDTIALYSAHQHATAGFPAVPLSRSLRLQWARGQDLATGDPILVPASLIWPSYLSVTRARTDPGAGPGSWPLTNPVIQAGLAAGPSTETALANALREVIERDAMALSWSAGLGLRELQPPGWLAAFTVGPQGALRTRFFALHEEFGVPVTAALVADEVTGYLSLGVGVHRDEVSSAMKAYAEALQLHLVLADYDDPHGAFAAAARGPRSPLKPWRKDRSYGTAYRPDRADVLDYACHLQLHLDPVVQQRFLTELDQLTSGSAALRSTGRSTPNLSSPELVTNLAAAGLSAVGVDLSTADIRRAGARVHRVVVPGLYSNAPLGLPFLGGSRWQRSRRLAIGPRPTTPLPH